MNSWKTSLFGLFAGIGAAVSMVDGIPHWLLIAARVAAAAGVAGLGISARDNNKTSEDVGAQRKPAPGKITLPALALAAIIALNSAGCSSTPQTIAYRAAGTTVITVDKAMNAWADYVTVYHPPAAIELEVKGAFDKYRAAMLIMIDAAQVYVALAGSGSSNAPAAQADVAAASAAAAAAFADLLNLLRSFGVNL